MFHAGFVYSPYRADNGQGGGVEAEAERAGEALEGRHCMYVVECSDGSWYTGYATDVARRIATHNAGRGAKYTRSRRPVTLLVSAAFETKHEAMAAEYRFKRLDRAAKERLVGLALAGEPFEDVVRREVLEP